MPRRKKGKTIPVVWEYKCRRCGAIHTRECEYGVDKGWAIDWTNFTYGALHTLSKTFDPPEMRERERVREEFHGLSYPYDCPKLIKFHSCEDGGQGVTDLIGVAPKAEQ